jgi:hypothetical protein
MTLTYPDRVGILRNAKKLTPAKNADPRRASTGHHSLHKGKDTPNPVAVKDFLCFYIPMSRGKIVEKATADSVNTRNRSSTEDMHIQRVDYRSAGGASGSPTARNSLSHFREIVDVLNPGFRGTCS